MAVLWEKQVADTSYKVTQAGHSIRLYRNKVLHSQWNEKDPVKGYIWELFLLATLTLNTKVSRVLVLGVGGGAVIRLIHFYFPEARIDAIDLDRVHLGIAKKFFKVKDHYCELVCADAKDWLKSNHKIEYDLIIDDVFNEQAGVPARAISVDNYWIRLLLNKLALDGCLVINFADIVEWRTSQKKIENSLAGFSAISARHIECDNRIIYFSRNSELFKTIKNALKQGLLTAYSKHWHKRIFYLRREVV